MKLRLFSILSIVIVLLTFLAYNAFFDGNVIEFTRAVMV